MVLKMTLFNDSPYFESPIYPNSMECFSYHVYICPHKYYHQIGPAKLGCKLFRLLLVFFFLVGAQNDLLRENVPMALLIKISPNYHLTKGHFP